MLPVVEFPELVRHYAPYFESVFCEQAFIQFQRYLSGLLVSENKTVDGINRLVVVENRNQSSLNRLLTENPFADAMLNQKRLELLGSQPKTQMKPKGVLSVDDTLLTHYGQHFDQIAYLYDHVHNCYVWAHNLVNLHYSDDDTDYPVYFQLWKPADLERLESGLPAAGVTLRASKFELKDTDPKKWRQYLLGVWRRHQNKPAVGELYHSKLNLAQQMLSTFVETYPELELPVTFDNWYTQPAVCRFIDKTLQLPYVGTLANDDQVVLAKGPKTLAAFAAQLKKEHRAAVADGEPPVFGKIRINYKGDKQTYYSYCQTHRIHNFGKQRLVINYRQADLSDSPVFYNANRLYWQATGITRIRRHRWPVEVYHEEGKAEGLDQYQVRDFDAIYRHIALVAVTYSLLKAAQHDQVLSDKLRRQLEIELEGSVPHARRAVQAQALWSLGLFISTGLTQGQSLHDILAPLVAAMAY